MPAQRQAFGVALDEYRAVQLALGDTAEAHLNLGIVELRRGRTARAEDAYRTAIRLRPDFVPARVNLANLLNGQGRNREAETQLRAALSFHTALAAGLEDTPPARAERGEIHYSLALLLAEAGRLDEAERELARSVELLPDRARIRYNRGLALQQLGRRSEAEASLLAAEALAPNDPDIQNALAILYAQAGDQEPALHHAERLVEITGGEAGAREQLDRIRSLQGR